MATMQSKAQEDADYADEFSKEPAPKQEMSEDESMGIAPETVAVAESAPAEPEAAQVEGVPAEEVAETPVEEAAEPAMEAKPMTEQQLKSWEGRIKAKEQELEAREAAMTSSNVGETETSSEAPTDEAGGESPPSESMGEDDGAKELAEDFGEDFVRLLSKFVSHMVKKSGGTGGDDSIAQTVDALIGELREERQQNHFNRISEAHADFMEMTESPEFMQWKDSQEDKEHLDMVIDSGSAKQIIDMLTKYKESQSGGGDMADDEALAAAEGVRSQSGGLKLPTAPTNNQDYEAAWNEA